MKTRLAIGLLVLVAVGLSAAAPPAWSPDAGRLEWQHRGLGLDRAIVDVAGGGEGWRTRIIAVRIDPARFHFSLRGRLQGVEPAWSVDRAPADAVLALNVGQFNGITPWGWVVMDGQEVRPPGRGPLSMAIAWDRAGRVQWLAPDEIDRERTTAGFVQAFQSYPMLIDVRGEVPRQIREPRLGVDIEHRDAPLAIGALPDGQTGMRPRRVTRRRRLGAAHDEGERPSQVLAWLAIRSSRLGRGASAAGQLT